MLKKMLYGQLWFRISNRISKFFVAFYSPNNNEKLVKILASCGFKNRLAKKTDLQSFKCSCSSIAPRPLCDASGFTLVFSFMSKCVFSINLTFSDMFFSKAMVFSPEQLNVNFLYKNRLKWPPYDARFRTKLMNWLVDPKNKCNSFKFRVIGIDFFAKLLSSIIINLVLDILISILSICFLKKIAF